MSWRPKKHLLARNPRSLRRVGAIIENFNRQIAAQRMMLVLIIGLAPLCAALRAYDAPQQPSIVGSPIRLEVFPCTVNLVGPRSRMQLVVTGHYSDGSVRDLTRASQFATTAADVATVDHAVAQPHH